LTRKNREVMIVSVHMRPRSVVFWVCLAAAATFAVWVVWPHRFFSNAYSPVVEDRDGMLVGARIAADGQWRFPPGKRVPDKFVRAIVAFEDKRFFLHPGVDPLSLSRAAVQNITAGRIVSGGSTITMQVIRLSRMHARRSVWEKIVESVLAVRADMFFRKQAVLSAYAAHAPFGGNVVGLEAAAWRYFGRDPNDLSWAETAMLAVLPNEPSLVHLGKNRARLLYKRNLLLQHLCAAAVIDSQQFRLAASEPLPGKPCPLPDIAPHLVDRILSDLPAVRRFGGRVTTTLSMDLQLRTAGIIARHHRDLEGRGIHNAAALVLSVDKGEALAYVGNVAGADAGADAGAAANGRAVDVIRSPRSTGSVLKPLLYASMLDQGELLPTSLVPDIPTSIGGFAPRNYNRSYEGAVPAKTALARSLNVPAVRMVQIHGIERFYTLLKNLGMTTLTRPASDYGISIILGGAEGTLWELAGIYAGMARTVNRYGDAASSVNDCFFFPPTYRPNRPVSPHGRDRIAGRETPLSPAACWAALDAMQEVSRPGEEGAWREFTSSHRVAWKTGTSFGFRDGWAIGCTPLYAVGVWVGNASGEGRPGLIGIEVAAPILFDILNMLPAAGWFPKPELQLTAFPVCRQSGFRAGPYCEALDTVLAPEAGGKTGPCPYHQIVHLDITDTWRVNASCESVGALHRRPWFILPPAIEWYYRMRHSDYHVLPPWRPDCRAVSDRSAIGLLYPQSNAGIFVPREINGGPGKTVFEATHRDALATLYWHIDDTYIGTTNGIHQMAVHPSPGDHVLVIVDGSGERLERRFTIIDK
jgi:penicillin-binding protein 1C